MNRQRITIVVFLLLALVLTRAAGRFSMPAPPRDAEWNRRHNGIWLQHGWLGADEWFKRYHKEDLQKRLHDPAAMRQLHERIVASGIKYIFPHLAPTQPDGRLPPVDEMQTHLFLKEFSNIQVLPWVGGVQGKQVFAHDPAWRFNFSNAIRQLLNKYPRLAGVQLNIEPWPSGDRELIALVREVKQALPPGRILSVAAYPPPVFWQPSLDIHWQREYYQEISANADQLVVMMYDSATPWSRLYRWLVSKWTEEILSWSESTDILLGLPAYDDDGVDYHDPQVENLPNGLTGVSTGLQRLTIIPESYQGICLYAEWEMDEMEWRQMR